MTNINDEIEVKIIDMNQTGNGIAKIEGYAVFVPGAVDSDVCDILISQRYKNYLTADIKKVVSPSPYREANDCPYYDECGGCSLRHITYEHEAEIKKSTVTSAFRRFNLKDIEVRDTICPSPVEYRNKAVFHFDAEFNVGYFKKSSNDLVKFTNAPCMICPKIFHDIAIYSSEYFKTRQDIVPKSLFMRISTSGKISVCLETAGRVSKSSTEDFCARLNDKFPDIAGIVLQYKRKDGIRRQELILGRDYIENDMSGLTFKTSTDSFFQVNYEGTALLFEVIKNYVLECTFKRCADLFCGAGIIGTTLAKMFPDAEFYGIDINQSAIENARDNAQNNNINNIKFLCKDASEIIDSGKPELIILDPPRKGCSDKMISILKSINAANVIYVSCNPFSLARDAAKLASFGYQIKTATPVNMFPRTEHVETVVMLSREK